jgi:hypothetical protein
LRDFGETYPAATAGTATKSLREKSNFASRFKVESGVQIASQKYSHFFFSEVCH